MITKSNFPKKLATMILSVGASISLSNLAQGGRSVGAIADCHVYAYDYLNWNQCNWGSDELLAAGWNPTGGEKRTYLKFDLAALNPGPADTVKLRLYHYHTAGDAFRDITIHEVAGDWVEGTGTYSGTTEPDAAPGEISWMFHPPFDPNPAISFNPGDSPGRHIEVDVTDLVRGWLSGRPNHGLVITELESSGSESVFGFYSREHEEVDKRPSLVIDGPLSIAPMADTHVYSYSFLNWNNCNWGSYDILGAGWNPAGGEKRTYLKFDLAGIIPGEDDRAILRLYHYHTAGDPSGQLTIHQVTDDWIEGVGTYSGMTEPDAAPGEISWEFQPPFNPENIATFSPGGNPGDFVEVDITELVERWLSGEPNHGLVIAAQETSGPESVFGFFSREREDADKHPALIFVSPDTTEAPIKGLTVTVQDGPTPHAILEWESAPGDLFQVLYSDDLVTWRNDLPGNFISGPTGQDRASFTDAIDLLTPRFYRIARIPAGSQ